MVKTEWEITEQLREVWYPYFGDFFIPFVEDGLPELEKYLLTEGRRYLREECISEMIGNWANELIEELVQFAVRMLVVEIRRLSEDKKLIGKTSEDRYRSYMKLLGEYDYLNMLKGKYPRLFSLLNRRVNYKVAAWTECLKRLFQDRKMLKSMLGIDVSEMVTIQTSSGDTHNHGRKVLIIQFKNAKLVYKPHSLAPDTVYDHVINILSKKLNCDLGTTVTIDRGDYGWQEFVEKYTSNKRTHKELKEYYYNAGVILAASYGLICTDLHGENVISGKKYPVVIDLETLSQNTTSGENKGNKSALENLFADYNCSVLGTMFITTKATFGSLDFDDGGIASNQGQQSKKFFSCVLKDKGTDNVHFDRVETPVDRYDNKVYDGDVSVNIRKYKNEIIQGFREAYAVLEKYKKEISDYLLGIKAKVRQVLRPTAVFARLLEASTYPDYMVSDEAGNIMLDKLFNGREKETALYRVAEQEKVELQRGDVPYVYALFDKKSVFINNVEIEDYYERSLADIISDHINSLCEKDLEKQIHYIYKALSVTKMDESEKTSRIRIPMDDKSSLGFVKGVAEWINGFLSWSEDRSECQLITNYQMPNDCFISINNCSIYDCGGIVLFFVYLAKYTKEQRYIEVAKAMYKGLHNTFTKDNYSFFNGVGAFVYLTYTLYKATGEKEYLDILVKTYGTMNEDDLVSQSQDIIVGISGTIIMSLDIEQTICNPIISEKIDMLAEKLFDDMSNDRFVPMTGLAHGYSGCAWALIKYGAVRNKKDFIELGMEQINIENRYFCKEQGGWRDVRYPEEFVTFRYWCHGSAGILIARTKVKDILEHYNDSSKKRWIETIDHDIAFVNQQIMSGTFFEKNTNLGLCHGAAGQLDALLIMNKYMRIQELGRIAEEEKNIFLDELMNSSIKTGDPQIMDDEGFMNGVTGIAYEVLRILDPEIPAVLGLEI